MSSTTSTTSAAVTLQHCVSEPIHTPGTIEPSGALFAVGRPGLVSQVLDLSRLQGGLGLGIHPEACDLGTIRFSVILPTQVGNRSHMSESPPDSGRPTRR